LRSREAAMAAKVLHIPSIALLTLAGPGSYATAVQELLHGEGLMPEGLNSAIRAFEPNLAAVRRLNKEYKLALEEGYCRAFGWMDALSMASTTLVTTCKELQDPTHPALAQVYSEEGTTFDFVGPLLDKVGARRAGSATCVHTDKAVYVMERVHQALAADRPVVLVSMGTILTGSHPHLGWEARPTNADGQRHGLSGRELVQAAWAGVFDALGTSSEEEGAFIVVSTGPRANALEDLKVPPNAICAASLPQVDILKVGVRVFVTHAGQNSFMESLIHGTPVVACPGFADQFGNARKAVNLGVGLKVDRPDPNAGQEADAQMQYRGAVCNALRTVWSEPSFSMAASCMARRLRDAGGVQHASRLIINAATKDQNAEMAFCGGA